MEKPSSSSPCAACKLLRRRCEESCKLAPFFPPNEPQRFGETHRVFGASNIIRMLDAIPMERRADAVNSMVFEANARHTDPVYGCAGRVWQLQQQLLKLQAEKAILQAQLTGAPAFTANQNNKKGLLEPQSETKGPL